MKPPFTGSTEGGCSRGQASLSPLLLRDARLLKTHGDGGEGGDVGRGKGDLQLAARQAGRREEPC